MQREKEQKAFEDQPAFENPRESIKSFTESLQGKKSALSEVLKRRALVNQKANITKSLPRVKSIAKMYQQRDFFKYDTLFNF